MKVFEKCPDALLVAYPRPPAQYTPEEVEEAFSAAMTVADLSEEQAEKHKEILRWLNQQYHGMSDYGQVLTLGGHAGTGKTTLLGVLANTLSGSNVAYCALTGRASSILRKKLQNAGARPAFVGTVHSLFYQVVEDKKTGRINGFMRKNPKDIAERFSSIVVDEASMVDETMATDLCAPGLPVLAVGDHGQLPPVYGISEWMLDPMLKLEHIHRQAAGSPIITLATHVREQQSLDDVPHDGKVVDIIKPQELEDQLREAYKKHSPREVAVLVYTNALRQQLNRLAHYVWTGKDTDTPPPAGSWLICLKNEKESGLCNGMRGELVEDARIHREHWLHAKMYYPNEQLEVQAHVLRPQLGRHRVLQDLQEIQAACCSDDMPKWRQVGLLMDYGYAMTVHKAQGSQFKHVFLVHERPNGISKKDYGRWLYTGVTRASSRLTLVMS